MRAFTLKIVGAATLAAAGMMSVPAVAQVSHDESWPKQFQFVPQDAERDPGAASAKVPPPRLQVNASPSTDIVLNGGSGRGVPDILGDKPNIVEYRFGLQIPF